MRVGPVAEEGMVMQHVPLEEGLGRIRIVVVGEGPHRDVLPPRRERAQVHHPGVVRQGVERFGVGQGHAISIGSPSATGPAAVTRA